MLKDELPEFLTELENAVLSLLLEDDSSENGILRAQLAQSSLESRERNGYGFFTHFKIEESAHRCERSNFELGDASAVISGQQCGFILFVREYKVSFLESFPLGGDEWPSPETIEKVTRFHSC